MTECMTVSSTSIETLISPCPRTSNLVSPIPVTRRWKHEIENIRQREWLFATWYGPLSFFNWWEIWKERFLVWHVSRCARVGKKGKDTSWVKWGRGCHPPFLIVGHLFCFLFLETIFFFVASNLTVVASRASVVRILIIPSSVFVYKASFKSILVSSIIPTSKASSIADEKGSVVCLSVVLSRITSHFLQTITVGVKCP